MDPHRSFSNSIVKGYSGEDTKRGAFWENNTMSKFFDIIVCFTLGISKILRLNLLEYIDASTKSIVYIF